MTENRYSFVAHARHQKCSMPDMAVVKFGLKQMLNDWDLHNRLSAYWLLYWNDTKTTQSAIKKLVEAPSITRLKISLPN